MWSAAYVVRTPVGGKYVTIYTPVLDDDADRVRSGEIPLRLGGRSIAQQSRFSCCGEFRRPLPELWSGDQQSAAEWRRSDRERAASRRYLGRRQSASGGRSAQRAEGTAGDFLFRHLQSGRD